MIKLEFESLIEDIENIQNPFKLGRTLNDPDAVKILSDKERLTGSIEFIALFKHLNNLRLPQDYITTVYDDVLRFKGVM